MAEKGTRGTRRTSRRCPEFEGVWGKKGECTVYTREPIPEGYTPPSNTTCGKGDQLDFVDFNPGVDGKPPGRLYHLRPGFQEYLNDRCTCARATNTAGRVRRGIGSGVTLGDLFRRPERPGRR